LRDGERERPVELTQRLHTKAGKLSGEEEEKKKKSLHGKRKGNSSVACCVSLFRLVANAELQPFKQSKKKSIEPA